MFNPQRVFNFSAGPSMLPQEVLDKARDQMYSYESSGQNPMEMSHRSPVFEDIAARVQSLLRELMNIPDNYRVLFLQGGASLQFSMVPLNLMVGSGVADYVDSGNFAANAIKEAKRFGRVNVVASSKADGYAYVPQLDPAKFTPNADYFHITGNNTIFGTRYTELPDTGDVPLVNDLSSAILSEPIDVSKFGLIYAGAQKNIGPAGVTVVIIREDLIGKAPDSVPALLNYKTQADADSLYNTPVTYSIYIALLVFEWLKALGGVEAIYRLNVEKAGILYDYLDGSDFYTPVARKEHRSLMNVTFRTPGDALDAAFVKQAQAQGLVNLKGHRIAGGMRASIYNAMPREGIEKLVAFMDEFARNNG